MHASRTMLVAFVILLGGCASNPPVVAGRGGIRVDHTVIPAAAEAGGPVAAYAGFDNPGIADKLLGIRCDCAASVELHQVVRDGDQVTMTNTFPLALPAGCTEVKPPGVPLHFMLIGTRRAFVAGEQVMMRLRFERAGSVDVAFSVTADSKTGWTEWVRP